MRKKPYGHTAYTRKTASGKLVQVRAKGVKPKDEVDVEAAKELVTYIHDRNTAYAEGEDRPFPGNILIARSYAADYTREYSSRDTRPQDIFSEATLRHALELLKQHWDASRPRPRLVLTPTPRPTPSKFVKETTYGRKERHLLHDTKYELPKGSEVTVTDKDGSTTTFTCEGRRAIHRLRAEDWPWVTPGMQMMASVEIDEYVKYQLSHGSAVSVTIREADDSEEREEEEREREEEAKREREEEEEREREEEAKREREEEAKREREEEEERAREEGVASQIHEALASAGVNAKSASEAFSNAKVRCEVHIQRAGRRRVDMGGIFYDRNTNVRIGSIDREFTIDDDTGELRVYHAYFKIDKDYQGQGLATKIMAASDVWYRAMGVQEISVHANIDTGGYTWAKFGFEFSEAGSDLQNMRGRFLRKIEEYGEEHPDAAPQLKKLKTKVKKFTHPWQFAAVVLFGKHVGRDWLLGASWHGYRRYDWPKTHPAQRVFSQYLKKQKEKGKGLKKADDGDDLREGSDEEFLDLARKLGFLTEIGEARAKSCDMMTDLLKSATYANFASTVRGFNGKVQKIEDGRFGARKVTFPNGQKGVLKPKLFSTDRFRGIRRDRQHLHEVAAYELDSKLLRFGIVPPTVLTTYEDIPASIQSWVLGVTAAGVVDGLMKHDDKYAERVALFAAKVNAKQLRKVVLFDLIVNNVDRHGKNCLFDTITDKVWAIDNGLTFGPDFARYNNVFHRRLFRKNLTLTSAERELLESITEEELDKVLGKYLTVRQVADTRLRIKWMLAQPSLGFDEVSQGRYGKDEFPAYSEWFKNQAKMENKLIARIDAMGAATTTVA